MIYVISRELETLIKNQLPSNKNHSSGILNCRLDYILISNKLQQFSNKAIILPAFKTDHSSVSVIVSIYPGLWKFNFSLISDKNFKILLKIWKKISTLKILLMTKWNRSIWISKSENSWYHIQICAKNNRKIKKDLKNKLKDLEQDLNNYDKLQKYLNKAQR